MRCASCQTENPETATQCSSCQAALSRQPAKARRRKAEKNGDPLTARGEAYNRQVLAIWRVSLWSAVPFFGLVLGPIGASRAWKLLREARQDPEFQAERAAQVAFRLGAITGVSNWLGLGLMLLGWHLG